MDYSFSWRPAQESVGTSTGRRTLVSMTLSGLLLVFTSVSSLAGSAKSLEQDFGPLIGNWTCQVSESGRPDTQTHVKYEWLYDGKVLKETITSPAWSGQFMTTLDKKSATYKGVAVDSSGAYIIWENPGFENNKSTEVGYLFRNGVLVPVSRTDFELVSGDHYIIHDFMADTPTGKGLATDTEDCRRVP